MLEFVSISINLVLKTSLLTIFYGKKYNIALSWRKISLFVQLVNKFWFWPEKIKELDFSGVFESILSISQKVLGISKKKLQRYPS